MAKDVFILGGAQSDFSRNIEREGGGLFELFRDVADGRLDAEEGEQRLGELYPEVPFANGFLHAVPGHLRVGAGV